MSYQEDFYQIEVIEEYVEDDEISTTEQGFMQGYIDSDLIDK